jgi:hypothetical protein
MITNTFLINLGFYAPLIFKKFKRYGPDTTAYINQAGQFALGQTNYFLLSSGQGPCYYPAGHLWHYIPIYHLYMFTDNAEMIYRTLHMVINSLVLTLIGLISYKYFKNDHLKA